MSVNKNPAFLAFARAVSERLVFAQVAIEHTPQGWQLRHVSDSERDAKELHPVNLAGLRALTQNDADGRFRPLKAAPTLTAGWIFTAANEFDLGEALERIYPGAVADWFAFQNGAPQVTSFREFTGRQTGMYRTAAMLNDQQASAVIRACCHSRFCLKQRLWTVTGLPSDSREGKSVIPCLEPCAVLLESARKAMRIEQEEKSAWSVAPSEVETLLAALENALAHPNRQLREADIASPDSPRRLQLLKEKLAQLPVTQPPKAGEH